VSDQYALATIAAQQASTVRLAFGATFYFESETRRLLYGAGTRRDPQGNLWEGVNRLIGIEGLAVGIGRRKQQLKLNVSGLDERAMLAAQGQAKETRGRKLEITEHYFKTAPNTPDDWQYTEPPVVVATYIMDKMTPTWNGPSGDRGPTVAIEIICEPRTASRWRAPNHRLDHRAHTARYPTDMGLSFVGDYVINQSLGMW